MKRVCLSGFALAAALAAAPVAAADMRQSVDAWRAAHEAAVVGQLDELTRFKSVAASPEGTAAAAAKLEGLLKERGFRTAKFEARGGSPPVVFGALGHDPAKRTVVFYAHYDGQPVTPSQWSSDPFVPVMRAGPLGSGDVDWKQAKPPYDPEWRLFARAAADDKASIIAFLAAFDALKAAGIPPSVNIKVVWEGEEEAGSPHLAEILKEHAGELKSDAWLIGDGPVHQSRRQSLVFGARGALDVEMTIFGPIRALHDGHYGNWVPNPAVMAAQLISEMRNTDGKILIPGFYDDVRPLSDAEKAAIAKLPPVEDQLKHEYQIGRSEGDEGLTASTMRPALNVRGLRAGQVAAEAANAIPVDAEISIDFRLVPNQTPDGVRRQVEQFLRDKGWTIVSATPDAATRLAHPKIILLKWGEGYAGLRADMSSAVARAMIAAADKAAGQPVALLPMFGGSVPLYMFDAQFKVPTIILPIVNHDDSQHAANENLRLRNLWDGIDTYAAMMSQLNW
ncbi:MAG TPA: M20/M25/M40 family metallo-hydrolase [Rhizomicrobium sp.]|nr:M20/M25/M40 family metallo-hydrolase [Rhizomicrobium sp.]